MTAISHHIARQELTEALEAFVFDSMPIDFRERERLAKTEWQYDEGMVGG